MKEVQPDVGPEAGPGVGPGPDPPVTLEPIEPDFSPKPPLEPVQHEPPIPEEIANQEEENNDENDD